MDKPTEAWPFLQAGIDAGLTRSQASLLMSTFAYHDALNDAPQRTLRSMRDRAPHLFHMFPTISDHLVAHPTEEGQQIAATMFRAWQQYVEDYAKAHPEGREAK